MPEVGDIYRHACFYADEHTGELLPKFLIVLTPVTGGELVARLITSRHAGLRPEQPSCYHGDPYPGFFLGVPGGSLDRNSWIDLRGMDDLDSDRFELDRRRGLITREMQLGHDLLCLALECAASAPDTTRYQERRIRDTLASLR